MLWETDKSSIKQKIQNVERLSPEKPTRFPKSLSYLDISIFLQGKIAHSKDMEYALVLISVKNKMVIVEKLVLYYVDLCWFLEDNVIAGGLDFRHVEK